jgi:protein-L-isoaspartate O-methyltransferase
MILFSEKADLDSPKGPYDAIHVGAAAPTLPQPLIDQVRI